MAKKDKIEALLPKKEYTLAEAKNIAEAFFRKDVNNHGRR